MKLSFPEHHLFQALKRFDNQHLPIDLFLSQYFRAHKALGSKDRLVITEAIYGMTRWRLLLDYLVDGSPSWEKRYAIFRSFQPEHFLHVQTIPLHTRVSFPKELFTMLETDHGQKQAIELCQIANTQAPVTVRANLLKTTRDDLLGRWQSLFDVYPCELSPAGIVFKKRVPLVSLPEFKEGLFEIQDEASQLAAGLVDAKPGDNVLDYCAGSGGKSLAFAHRLKNMGQIYLHDVRPLILEQAKKRLKRAGIQNAQVLTPYHVQIPHLKKKMDWVLVDAPCSGTGTLRRNPDQKWKFSFALLNRLIGQQRIIFEKALSFVKSGGFIVYATCSILKAENENQLEHFLKHYPLELISPPFTSLPAFGGMDGFFAAVFKRTD